MLLSVQRLGGPGGREAGVKGEKGSRGKRGRQEGEQGAAAPVPILMLGFDSSNTQQEGVEYTKLQ